MPASWYQEWDGNKYNNKSCSVPSRQKLEEHLATRKWIWTSLCSHSLKGTLCMTQSIFETDLILWVHWRQTEAWSRCQISPEVGFWAILRRETRRCQRRWRQPWAEHQERGAVSSPPSERAPWWQALPCSEHHLPKSTRSLAWVGCIIEIQN